MCWNSPSLCASYFLSSPVPFLFFYAPSLVLLECFLLCVSVFPFCLFTTFLCCCHIPYLTCSIFFFPSSLSLFHFTYFSFYLPPFFLHCTFPVAFYLNTHTILHALCVCLLCHSAVQLDCDSGYHQIPLKECVMQEAKGASF